MNTLKIGIMTPEEYKRRTIAIARGELKPSPRDPKLWFTSIESAAKILSQPNRELLALIAREKPGSLTELAERTGRAKSNLSRTLKTMERYGLVELQKGTGRVLEPRVEYRDVQLEVPVVGKDRLSGALSHETMVIDERFIIKTDGELIAQDVKLHARPFHVVMAWMRARKFAGDVMDHRLWDPLMEVYRRLYPVGDFSMPSMLVGGVALRDRLYFARVHVGYGRIKIEPLKCIDIPPQELELVWKLHPEQIWRALYGVADLWDFAYAVDDLTKRGTAGEALLNNARSSIAATARILAGDVDLDAAVQSACLTAELSMKAVLRHLGWSESRLKKLSHRLPDLAKAIIAEKPNTADDQLLRACSKFPDYVGTRYAGHGLSRLKLMELAMRAQFVAANAVRRISDRNLAREIEARGDSPKRDDI